jgi:hypothetical protein
MVHRARLTTPYSHIADGTAFQSSCGHTEAVGAHVFFGLVVSTLLSIPSHAGCADAIFESAVVRGVLRGRQTSTPFAAATCISLDLGRHIAMQLLACCTCVRVLRCTNVWTIQTKSHVTQLHFQRHIRSSCKWTLHGAYNASCERVGCGHPLSACAHVCDASSAHSDAVVGLCACM